MTLIADTAGERLDAFLARTVEGMTRSAAQRLIEEGYVNRNGRPGKKNEEKLAPYADKINIVWGDLTDFDLLTESIASIIEVKEESDIDSFLSGGQVSFLSDTISGLDDFELICFLVIR